MNHTDFIMDLPNGLSLRIGPGLFRPGTDTLSLAQFAAFKNGMHLVDLGCGCGAFPLLLAPAYPEMQITGIELDPVAAGYAVKNLAAAGLGARAHILQADFRACPLPSGCADAVISNPPYFPSYSGLIATSTQPGARAELTCSCDELVQCAARLLRNRGRFYVLWRPERLVDLFSALRTAGLEPKRMQAARGKRVRFVMVEALLGGKPGLLWEPDLLLSRR